MPPEVQSTEIFQAPVQTPPPPGGAAPAPPVPPGTVPPDIAAMMPPSGGGKKKFLFIGIGILLLVIIIFILIRVISSFSAPKNDEENAELTYWAVYEDPRVMQVLIDDFQRQNPNIKVNFVQQDAKDYRDRLLTRIRAGTGPDIYRYHNSWVPMLQTQLLPFTTDTVTAEEYEKTYFPVVTTDLVKNGAILGIPLYMDTLAMYTNDQMFTSQRLNIPQNWTEFTETAAALTTRVEEGESRGQLTTAGAALGTYDNITHAADIISLFLVQTRVDPTDIAASAPEAATALEYYTFFATGEGDEQKVWDGSLGNSVQEFAAGRVGMYFGYSWDIYTLQGINPSLSYSIHPVPQLSTKDKKTIASYWVEGVSSETKYPQSAMKFMKFLHQKETQQKYYTEKAKVLKIGRPYARRDLAASQKEVPQLAPFVSQAEFAVSTPFVADTQDSGLNATVNGYLKNAVLETLDNTSAESAVETLDQGVKQALGQYEEADK